MKSLIALFITLVMSGCVTTANDDYSTDVLDEINERSAGG